ncbi:histidine kinase [Actinomadura sp. K4S16]|uniref:histidine kinase n=1 Tax=Actinomadura sp. K4S16 TaxID=1316147 RepID=UPI001356F2AF|nr:histidine kinase [Actinomadura sp. K4S16]
MLDAVAFPAASRGERISWWIPGSRVEGHLKPRSRTDLLASPAAGFVPLATMGAVAYSVLIPAVELWRFVLISTDTARTAGAVLATAGYLPLHVRHVRHAARGTRPPRAGWTVAAMALIIVGVLPYLGALWLGQFHALAVSVLIVLRRPWSVALFGVIVAAQPPLAVLLGRPDMAAFFTIAGALKGLPVFLLIWLVGAVRRLHAARRALADRAVARERLRIDRELRETVGAALESITVRGERAGALAGSDRAAAEAELRALAGGSRQALAEARRLVRGYQRTSLHAALDTATTLLSAAGIESRVVLPDGDVPDTVDEALHAALRADVARLLQDDLVRRCVIVVARHDGRLRLEARAEPGDPAEPGGPGDIAAGAR